MSLDAWMRIDIDEHGGRAVGSIIRMSGTVLGLRLTVEEIVRRRDPPWVKEWETRGKARLLVIDTNRMAFTITPHEAISRLVVAIEYRLSSGGVEWLFGCVLGQISAAWCTRRMVNGARAAFGVPAH